MAASAAAFQTVLRAAKRWDPLTWLAVVCLLLGWFLREMPDRVGERYRARRALLRPAGHHLQTTQLFFGVRHGYVLLALPFGLLCLTCVYALTLPYQERAKRESWLLHLLPLALLVGCYALLYHRTGHDLINTDPDTVAGDITRLTNNIWSRGTALVARHVSVAGGAYVALAGSLFLAARGIQRYVKSA